MKKRFINGLFVVSVALLVALALLLFYFLPPSREPSLTALKIINDARLDCASFDNGQFQSSGQAISYHDVTGNEQLDEIIDTSHFSCSTAHTLWGGTGGTYLWVVTGDRKQEFLAKQWKVVDMKGQPVLLLAVHHSQCSDKLGPCYRTYVWNHGFQTTNE